MRCPTLTELPPPPADKTGWPWTEEDARLPEVMPNGRPWPRLTIVTPSYNQGPFLEATLRSVLLQGYPNLEYIVIDGGSQDDSVNILRRYALWLTEWVSEPDRGQADAINQGFARATGEIFGWLNSDDLYEPGALHAVARYFAQTPDCMLLYGDGWYLDAAGTKTRPYPLTRPFDPRCLLTYDCFPILQPAAFWRRSLWQQTGPLNIAYHYAMEWDWFIRAITVTWPHYLPRTLAGWRLQPAIKTRSGGQARRAEIAAISKHYGGRWHATYLLYQGAWLAWWLAGRLGTDASRRALRRLSARARTVLTASLWRAH
jgi:glycosyltransferase involved in cell wall biosynthesis